MNRALSQSLGFALLGVITLVVVVPILLVIGIVVAREPRQVCTGESATLPARTREIPPGFRRNHDNFGGQLGWNK